MNLLGQQIQRSLSVHRSSITRKLICDTELPLDIVDALWHASNDELLRYATPMQEKDRCSVMRCNHPKGSFVLKSLNWGKASRSIRMLLREPAARRCASIGLRLIDKGIPTPRPRAVVVDGFGPFSHRSILLTDYVDGVSLFHCLRSDEIPTESIADLASQFVTLWDKMITYGISHNDLKPENLIVDESMQLWIIDLEMVKFHQNKKRMRQLHLKDLERFFHIRSWRDQPEAAEIFRRQLVESKLGEWFNSNTSSKSQYFRQGYSSKDLESRISVAIVTDIESNDHELLQATTDSVKDLADQIVMVQPTLVDGRFIVQPSSVFDSAESSLQLMSEDGANNEPQFAKLDHSWVFVIHAGECATPDIVRLLPETIVRETDCDAVAMPIDEWLFGHSTRRQSIETRFFHQDRCRISLEHGRLQVNAAPDKIVTIDKGIKRLVSPCLEDYIACLNCDSDRGAQERFERGCKPHLLWGLMRSGNAFFNEYFLEGIFRSGWIGLQVAILNSGFVWIEEAKLWQRTTRDRHWAKPHSTLFRTRTAIDGDSDNDGQEDKSRSILDAA